MSAYLLVSLHTNTGASAASTTLDPVRCSTLAHRAQTGAASELESGGRMEAGAQQFAFGNSALGHLESASTLAQSISDSAIISGGARV